MEIALCHRLRLTPCSIIFYLCRVFASSLKVPSGMKAVDRKPPPGLWWGKARYHSVLASGLGMLASLWSFANCRENTRKRSCVFWSWGIYLPWRQRPRCSVATQLAEISMCPFAGGLQHNVILVLLLYTGIKLFLESHPSQAWASLVTQTVKNLPAMQETSVQSLGWEDPLEEGMTTHSSTLAWKISWTEEPGGLQSMGSQRVRHDWVTEEQQQSGSLPLLARDWFGFGPVMQFWSMHLVNVEGKICCRNSGNVFLAPKKEAEKQKPMFSPWVFSVPPWFGSWNGCGILLLLSKSWRRAPLRVTAEKQSWNPGTEMPWTCSSDAPLL